MQCSVLAHLLPSCALALVRLLAAWKGLSLDGDKLCSRYSRACDRQVYHARCLSEQSAACLAILPEHSLAGVFKKGPAQRNAELRYYNKDNSCQASQPGGYCPGHHGSSTAQPCCCTVEILAKSGSWMGRQKGILSEFSFQTAGVEPNGNGTCGLTAGFGIFPHPRVGLLDLKSCITPPPLRLPPGVPNPPTPHRLP